MEVPQEIQVMSPSGNLEFTKRSLELENLKTPLKSVAEVDDEPPSPRSRSPAILSKNAGGAMLVDDRLSVSRNAIPLSGIRNDGPNDDNASSSGGNMVGVRNDVHIHVMFDLFTQW